jgi:hypothetical protein
VSLGMLADKTDSPPSRSVNEQGKPSVRSNLEPRRSRAGGFQDLDSSPERMRKTSASFGAGGRGAVAAAIDDGAGASA